MEPGTDAGVAPPHAHGLAEALREAHRLLARGVADRRSPFHTPTLATLGADGAPRARTLVLRGFDPASCTLRLHTDQRAAKVAELRRDPRAALHFYDPDAQVQLRLEGEASVHERDAVADAAWSGSRPFSRLPYAIEPAPGTPVPAPPPAPREEREGRAHFAALLFRFRRLEWLFLLAAGHRRALFTFGPDRSTWLIP